MNRQSRQQQVIKAFEDFLSTPLETILQRHLNTQTSVALSLFHDVVANVPAYRAFLAEREINPATIQTLEEFQKLPAMSTMVTELCRSAGYAYAKQNYILHYP